MIQGIKMKYLEFETFILDIVNEIKKIVKTTFLSHPGKYGIF